MSQDNICPVSRFQESTWGIIQPAPLKTRHRVFSISSLSQIIRQIATASHIHQTNTLSPLPHGIRALLSRIRTYFLPFFALFPQKPPDFLTQYEFILNLVNSGWISTGKWTVEALSSASRAAAILRCPT